MRVDSFFFVPFLNSETEQTTSETLAVSDKGIMQNLL